MVAALRGSLSALCCLALLCERGAALWAARSSSVGCAGGGSRAAAIARAAPPRCGTAFPADAATGPPQLAPAARPPTQARLRIGARSKAKNWRVVKMHRRAQAAIRAGAVDEARELVRLLGIVVRHNFAGTPPGTRTLVSRLLSCR